MHLPTATLLLSSALSALASTTLSLHLPPTQVLPQPQTLPPSTHARLTSSTLTLTAPLRRNNRFTFASVPAGSYLCDVWAHEHVFVPMRVDVSADGGIEVWQTYRGNEWGNTGEKLGHAIRKKDAGSKDAEKVEEDVVLEVNVGTLSRREFYETRGGFNPLGLLKNPMILIGIVGMAMMFGMPKLLENMDLEMREEFEKSQASNPLAALTGGGGGSGGFDMAGWMAGTDKQAPSQAPKAKASGSEGGSAKRRR